jgi:hypothetical protein
MIKYEFDKNQGLSTSDFKDVRVGFTTKTKQGILNFQQYFSYIMANRFSGGRSRSNRREPLIMGKQLVNFITCGCESSAPFLEIYKAGRKPTAILLKVALNTITRTLLQAVTFDPLCKIIDTILRFVNTSNHYIYLSRLTFAIFQLYHGEPF